MKEKTQQQRATSAFLKSGGYDFSGKEIAPFTPQRQAVASEMGMVWPWINSEDEVEITIPYKIDPDDLEKIPKAERPPGGIREIKLRHYRQSFKDCVIALWLCSQVESRVDRAERKPEEALGEAWAWAKKIGLNAGSQLAGEALPLWIQITNELAESKGEPIPKDCDPKGGDDAGEL